VATADPWHNFGSGCVGERCRYDPRPDDWDWSIWFHAREPHGLGWVDPGLSIDDDYCGIADAWLGSGEPAEMECSWSTGALCPSNRALFSLNIFESMGALGIVWVAIMFYLA
jgi:hypothetical protein